jgi:glycine/D-amino acid oxidase-like deaminating enzyme
MHELNIARVPVLTEVDVLVAGAGSAGCCAAISARGAGAGRVMLLDRYGFAGGTSTQILDTFYGFFTPGANPRKVVGGIADRVVDTLDDADAAFLRENTYGAGTGVTYNPERLKLIWDELLRVAGVTVKLHATVVDAEVTPSGRLSGVVISTKRGFFRIHARRFIDASGDADLCRFAEIPCEAAGESEPAQSLTTTFKMANVDLQSYAAAGGKALLMEKMKEAVERGTYQLPRKAGSIHPMAVEGCVATVATRVAGVDATDFEQLTQAEQEGRRQAFIYERFLRDCIPGFKRARIIALSQQIGVRESRRVYGEYRLTRADCLRPARFDDRVFLCGAPIEDHRSNGGDETVWAYVPNGDAYDVPYGTLVPRGREELWVAGRCFSATHDAHASCRSMAQTMSMGAAAGAAAALSLRRGCNALEVPIGELQSLLRGQGAVLEAPVERAHTRRSDWKLNRGSK